jgi:hypothetical protein
MPGEEELQRGQRGRAAQQSNTKGGGGTLGPADSGWGGGHDMECGDSLPTLRRQAALSLSKSFSDILPQSLLLSDRELPTSILSESTVDLDALKLAQPI